VSGLPSPFTKIYERGRETAHPSLWRSTTAEGLNLPELASEFSYTKRRALPTAALEHPHDTAAHTTNDSGGCNARRK